MMERAIQADKSAVTSERIETARALGSRPGAGRYMRETALALGSFRGVKAQWRQFVATSNQ